MPDPTPMPMSQQDRVDFHHKAMMEGITRWEMAESNDAEHMMALELTAHVAVVDDMLRNGFPLPAAWKSGNRDSGVPGVGGLPRSSDRGTPAGNRNPENPAPGGIEFLRAILDAVLTAMGRQNIPQLTRMKVMHEVLFGDPDALISATQEPLSEAEFSQRTWNLAAPPAAQARPHEPDPAHPIWDRFGAEVAPDKRPESPLSYPLQATCWCGNDIGLASVDDAWSHG